MEDYSFAVEYDGPPLPYAIPEAIPIEVDHIPVAPVVSDTDTLLLPVVDPIPSPVAPSKLLSSSKHGQAVVREPIVSPTSVIGYDHTVVDAVEGPGKIGSSGEVDVAEESVDFSNDTNLPLDQGSTASVASSEFGFCSEPEEDVAACVSRHTVLTSQDSCNSKGTSSPRVNERRENVKRGSCSRCFKGNLLTEKEVCIVCSAKYCSRCLLKAMGSMPEGRKCLSCIGYPIDESKREKLGKCSRMLKRLLCSLEVEQVMNAERYCDANQLRSEYVSVNGKTLSSDEMILLQTCPNPPDKLKPGHYWYDKVSGLWGKEGHKPHKIISPYLSVGGCLMENASNGNSGIFINGREVTNTEMKMLKLAGVQCAGKPHFWVNSDGTYQEEGHKIIKGNLWDKAGMKLICSILSLPFPRKATKPFGGEASDVTSRAGPDYLEQRSLQKLLLVGCHESGTSTIFKQAKFLYKSVPFTDEERENIKVMIQGSIYHYLAILLEARERFEEECISNKRKTSLERNEVSGDDTARCDDLTIYSICPRLKSFSDFLLKVRASGNLDAIFPAATREYAPLVEELWNNASIQSTYSRKSELQALPLIASYFLERVVDISRPEYEPSDMDILCADGIATSNGLACTEFSFPSTGHDCCGTDADSQHEMLLRYQLIRVHTKGLGENRKCLEMFEDARMVIFCASLSDYDEYSEDLNGVTINKMLASKKLFESIATHPTFEQMDFLLILNKFDQLELKIDQTPLTVCDWFNDFNPVTSRHNFNNNGGNHNNRSFNNASPAQQAFYYIAIKFKKLFTSLTGRKLYVIMANSQDSDSVDCALRYSREILKWEEERIIFGTDEFSGYSTDSNSF